MHTKPVDQTERGPGNAIIAGSLFVSAAILAAQGWPYELESLLLGLFAAFVWLRGR